VVCSSGQSNITNGNPSELADCGQLAAGAYTVQVVAFATVNATYSGSAVLGPEPVSPVGKARYKSGKFAFSTPFSLPGPDDLLKLPGPGIFFRVRAARPGSHPPIEKHIFRRPKRERDIGLLRERDPRDRREDVPAPLRRSHDLLDWR